MCVISTRNTNIKKHGARKCWKVRDRLRKDADAVDINYSVVGWSTRSCFQTLMSWNICLPGASDPCSPSPAQSIWVTRLPNSPSAWPRFLSSPAGALCLCVPPRERGLAALSIWGHTPRRQYHMPAPFRAPARCRARSHPSYATTALPAGSRLALPTVDNCVPFFLSKDTLLTQGQAELNIDLQQTQDGFNVRFNFWWIEIISWSHSYSLLHVAVILLSVCCRSPRLFSPWDTACVCVCVLKHSQIRWICRVYWRCSYSRT